MTIELLPAVRVPHAERAALWNEAFSDYSAPSHFDAEALAGFERMCDLDLEGSTLVAADGRLVASGMLGVRGRRAWVGGMGVVPSARRQGHGERVMHALIAAARMRGVETLGLEVRHKESRIKI